MYLDIYYRVFYILKLHYYFITFKIVEINRKVNEKIVYILLFSGII